MVVAVVAAAAAAAVVAVYAAGKRILPWQPHAVLCFSRNSNTFRYAVEHKKI